MNKRLLIMSAVIGGSSMLAPIACADVVWTDVTRNGTADFNPGTFRVWGGTARVVGDWTGETYDSGLGHVVGRTRAQVDSGPLESDRFSSTTISDGWAEQGAQVNMHLTVSDDIEFTVDAITPVFICASLSATAGTSSWVLLQEVSDSAQIIGLTTHGRTYSATATGGSLEVTARGLPMPGRYRYNGGDSAGAVGNTVDSSSLSACIIVPAPGPATSFMLALVMREVRRRARASPR